MAWTEVTVGRIVQYTLDTVDAERINARREDAKKTELAKFRTGAITHVGNEAKAGDVLPMIVVKVWEGGRVNGQVFLDGNDTYWATSVDKADIDDESGGLWSWPPRV